jgi:hypothetical protein
VTSGPAPASSPDGGARRRHPLEDSDRLAWQATAAVRLLERFGALLTVALDAVGSSDDAALDAALRERDLLVAQLEPLLAALAEARAGVRDWPGLDEARTTASQQALALILAPVDDALEHAQHLHRRLADETRGALARASSAATRPPARAVALVR